MHAAQRTWSTPMRLMLVAGGAQPKLARGGAGPPGWTMTLNCYRETVANKRVCDVTPTQTDMVTAVADGAKKGSVRCALLS